MPGGYIRVIGLAPCTEDGELSAMAKSIFDK